VRARTEAAFSALVGLDPLLNARWGPSEDAMSSAGTTDAGTEACLARIIATPRSGAAAATFPPRAPRWSAPPPRGRHRYGAIGLAASAAIAVITAVLWASPSAGSPPDQAASVSVQIGQTHSPARP
jgi:hypothetical protein